MRISIRKFCAAFSGANRQSPFKLRLRAALSVGLTRRSWRSPRENRILVSHDRATMIEQFARFTESQSSPGLILFVQEIEVGAAVEDLMLIWAASDADEWRDKMVFVPL